VWNWDDRASGPTLADARARVRGAVCGGLDQVRTLRHGAPEAAVAEAREAVASVDGSGVIVAPGCVLLSGTPDATVAAVVGALGGPLKPIPGLKPDA
jgi:uroporphyrinogen-III decarboxylase